MKLNSAKRIFIVWFCFFVKISCSQTIWSIGPMLHVNIGNQKVKCSWNVEAAYWNFSAFPWSIDMAIEIEKRKTRFYSELQTGIGVGGISIGPVLEFNREDKKTNVGWQSSLWGNYYLGFDFRYRKIGGKSFFAPGTYLKIPFNARDEFGEPIKSDGNSWDGWDD